MTYNILIEGMTDSILCFNVTEETAWALVKARWETLDQEEVWVYLDEGSCIGSANSLKLKDNSFFMDATDWEGITLKSLKYRFDNCMKAIKEG